MNEQNLKAIQESKNIYVRSFYSISRNLLTFCENNHVLFLEDQIIETYCHFMSAFLNDHSNTLDIDNLMNSTEVQIKIGSNLGYQLALLLKKSEKEYEKQGFSAFANKLSTKFRRSIHKKKSMNLPPYARKEILKNMDLNHLFTQTEVFLAEHIIMMHWDLLETMENVIMNTLGNEKRVGSHFQGDSLGWFLNQQLPASLIEVSQKIGAASKNFLLSAYQIELANWLGWLIGFYAAINKKSIHHELETKFDLLKMLIKEHCQQKSCEEDVAPL